MDEHHHQSSSMSWRMKAGFLVFATIAGFYLWTEHRAHLLGWTPFLIILFSRSCICLCMEAMVTTAAEKKRRTKTREAIHES